MLTDDFKGFLSTVPGSLGVSASILLFYFQLFFSYEGFSLVQGQHLLKESSLGMNCLQSGLDEVSVLAQPHKNLHERKAWVRLQARCVRVARMHEGHHK